MISARSVYQRSSENLVIVIPGWVRGSAGLVQVERAITDSLPESDILVLDYPNGFLSNADPCEIALGLVDEIDKAVKSRQAKGGEYRSITVIGYSLGALLARKVYVFANGLGDGLKRAGATSPPKPWADRIRRIILLAGMNRGWSLEPRPRKMNRLFWLIGRAFIRATSLLRIARLVRSAQRGSPFVANLRLEWLSLQQAVKMPECIQLLGTIDDLVGADDNIDLQVCGDFVFRRIPATNHRTIVDFSGSDGAFRKAAVCEALTSAPGTLVSDYVPEQQPDSTVSDVVFVMHGIRDRGFWTSEIEAQLHAEARRLGQTIRVIVASYGYFAMLPFLLLKSRQRNVRWFMDRYTEARARFPKARMHYIGHSNGTYLLASALQRYASARIDNVVFAGSVVRADFPWNSFAGRVGKVLNYVATADLVVGVFPGFLERLGHDIGSAGHNGFDDQVEQEFTFVQGGHSAALCPQHFPHIAAFVLGGTRVPDRIRCEARSSIVEWMAKLNWFWWIFLVGVAVVIGWLFSLWTWYALAGYIAVLIIVLCTV